MSTFTISSQQRGEKLADNMGKTGEGMKLNELLDGVALTARHVQDVECSGICCDTET